MNNARAFRIAQIATDDADEAMDLVHVARPAASSRPTASATAISSGPFIEISISSDSRIPAALVA